MCSFFLDCYTGIYIMWMMLKPVPAAYKQRQGPPLKESLAHSLYEILSVCYLAQGYTGSALKVSCHHPHYQDTFHVLSIPGLEPELCLIID